MDKKIIASELLKMAKDLVGFEHESEEALKEYLKAHPAADKSNHWVKKPSREQKPKNEHHAEFIKKSSDFKSHLQNALKSLDTKGKDAIEHAEKAGKAARDATLAYLHHHMTTSKQHGADAHLDAMNKAEGAFKKQFNNAIHDHMMDTKDKYKNMSDKETDKETEYENKHGHSAVINAFSKALKGD